MDALYEMIITLLMILFWAVELLYSLLDRVFALILLSFILLILWVDELFPINKEVKIPFNTRVFITLLIVLTQQILRFFL
ncbi:MAG: hypothetical protein D6733_06745 [Methanobacteriota archaeon]|nr:MAG: hypothetical protein D6733_06745 [Euryarchaeota archaeon]